MNEDDLRYCWDVLPYVSRSFALCIPKLPEKTRDIVCISYLICRIADTVEDSKERDIEKKRKQLNQFKNILLEERVNDLESFTEPVIQETPNSHESDLVKNTNRVINPFSALSSNIKDSVKRWISEMIGGMKEYLGREIVNFQDQDRYCYFVAGTVGKILTEIYYYRDHISLELFSEMIKLAPDFGLGLQKVNIIRNVRTDLEEGRVYWPTALFDDVNIHYKDLFKTENLKVSRKIANELIRNAQQHLVKGLEYILLIPKNQKEVRTYCSIPLFMAIATLSKCHNNPKVLFSTEDVKISKEQVEEILARSSEYSKDDLKIIRYYRSLKTF